jgi:hypothetical protein
MKRITFNIVKVLFFSELEKGDIFEWFGGYYYKASPRTARLFDIQNPKMNGPVFYFAEKGDLIEKTNQNIFSLDWQMKIAINKNVK